jgi:hypothetical protein
LFEFFDPFFAYFHQASSLAAHTSRERLRNFPEAGSFPVFAKLTTPLPLMA